MALGVVGAIFLSVGLAGCPGSLDPAVAMAVHSGAGGTSGSDGGQTTCTTAQAMTLLTASNHNCSQSGCHSSTTPVSGFDMQTAGWETRLVGESPNSMSQSCGSNGPYLVPGTQPATGLFLLKLTPQFPCGAQMPFVGDKLTATEMACIQSWANTLVAAAGSGGGTDGGGGQ